MKWGVELAELKPEQMPFEEIPSGRAFKYSGTDRVYLKLNAEIAVDCKEGKVYGYQQLTGPYWMVLPTGTKIIIET